MPYQNSATMQSLITRWLHATVVSESAEALMPEVAGCERFLRAHGIDEIPPEFAPGIIGVPAIDNLLNQWFLEHRPKEIRRRDGAREHLIRDLNRVRPVTAARPKTRRRRK
jgi:hypothetical protein